MFISDPKKRKEFDRTSHELCSSWPQMARKHKRLFLVTVLSVVIGAAISVLMAGNTPMIGESTVLADKVLWALMGAGIPFIILAPLSIMSYKNHVFACCSEAACRYRDLFEFQDNQAVYWYRSRRGGSFAGEYEHTIRYDLIEKIIYDERKKILVITAGGVDTEFRRNGNVERRINFMTGNGYVNPYARAITIPMVYSNNKLFLTTLEKYSPVPIQYGNADEDVIDTEME